MVDHRTDADNHLDPKFLGDSGGNLLGDPLELLGVRTLGQLLDEGHIGLIDGDDKVHLLVREKVLNHIDGTHIGRAQLPYQESGPGSLREEVQLLGLGIDVPQQDVVRNNILHKGSLVVLLLIIGLGSVEGHHRHRTQGCGSLILALNKGGVIELGAPARQGPESLILKMSGGMIRRIDSGDSPGPVLANARQLAACHHDPVRVDHSYCTVDTVLHLEYNSLKHPAGHV